MNINRQHIFEEELSAEKQVPLLITEPLAFSKFERTKIAQFFFETFEVFFFLFQNNMKENRKQINSKP